MILGAEPDGELSRILLRYEEISAELKGALPPHVDNVRYTFRVERAKCIGATYWRTTYRIIDMARVVEAAKLLEEHGIRCGCRTVVV